MVLSACDTGLGEVRAGEGVFGLRRAFAIAGARSLVMSMLQVEDEWTKELMVEFYQNMESKKKEALRYLEWVVRQERFRGRVTHPTDILRVTARKMRVWPLGAALQEEASNRLELLG